jgi:hypothetical protein
MRSIDLPEEVVAQVRELRERTGLNTTLLLTRCLQAFETVIAASRKQRASGRPRKRALEIERTGGMTSPGDSALWVSNKRRVGIAKKPEPAVPKVAAKPPIRSRPLTQQDRRRKRITRRLLIFAEN